MIKTIKVKKQLRLDELIKHVWDSKDNGMMCISDKSEKEVTVMRNYIDCNDINNGIIAREDTFTVEVEEEITEDRIFGQVVLVSDRGLIKSDMNRSIKYAKNSMNTPVKEVHAVINGKLELIYERGGSDEIQS